MIEMSIHIPDCLSLIELSYISSFTNLITPISIFLFSIESINILYNLSAHITMIMEIKEHVLLHDKLRVKTILTW